MRTTYIVRDGKLIEKRDTARVSTSPMIMRDIQPYKSMIDGSTIQSRSRHRDHLRAHGCIEVGNEKMETKLAAPSSEQRRQVLRQQVANMSDREANHILQSLRNDSRFNTPHRK